MRRVLLVVLLVFALAGVARAAEPLAYKNGFAVGATFERESLDTDHGNIFGNSWGEITSYSNADVGFSAHLAAAAAGLKADSNNQLGEGMSLSSDTGARISLELSKRMHKFEENGVQLGVFAKYSYYTSSLEGNVGHTCGKYQQGVFLGDYSWSNALKIENLQKIEVGILAQKDWENVHLFAGPELQLMHANARYVDANSDGDVYRESEKVRENSIIAAAFGIACDIGKEMSVQLTGTLKEHATIGVALKGNLEKLF